MPRGVLALGVAGVIATCAFLGRGGTSLASMTWVEVGLLILGAGLASAALLFGAPGRLHGGLFLLAFGLFAALIAVSIVWSLAPDDSWRTANLGLAYLAVVVAGMALARLVAGRWAELLAGVALAAVVVCGWALVTKVFPDALASGERFARLRAPFGYWNSVGLMAASGIPALVWLAARRAGHQALNALAWPAIGLLLVCLMLAYSRGSIVVLAAGLAVLLAVLPLRLRAAAALGVPAALAAPVVAWAFAQDGLSRDDAPMAARVDAGHELGALLVLLATTLAIAGLVVGFVASRRSLGPRSRRRAGGALLGGLAVVPVIALIVLAEGPGGLGGQLSTAYRDATDPSVGVPSNSPSRLTAASSVRARYWHEALDVHRLSPWIGTGAGSYGLVRERFRRDTTSVQHAHSSIYQTLADLGWLGLALAVLATGLWVASAARTLGLRRSGWDAERVGFVTLAVIVIMFGLHSALDWTWFVPGNAVPALLCAGWVAARGPLREHPVPPSPLRRRPPPARAAAAAVLTAGAVAAAWAVVQPLRAQQAQDAAYAELARGNTVHAAALARAAHERDPLATAPLLQLGAIEVARGDRAAARGAFEAAVRLQPSSPEPWRELGRFRMNVLHDPKGALDDFRTALFLDPQSFVARSDVIDASRALRAQAPVKAAPPAPPASAARPAPRPATTP